MSRDIENADRDKKIDDLVKKQLLLDSVCKEIYFTLLAYRKRRFNELLRTLKKFDVKISKPTLQEHLTHLINLNLIERNEEGFQNVSYSLTKEIDSLMNTPTEVLKQWIDSFSSSEGLPDRFKPLKIPIEELYKQLSPDKLDKMAIDDLENVLSRNLFELKTYIEYDIKLEKFQSDEDFWNIIGYPLYRNSEKSIADKCRASEAYKKMLFEKIELLIGELRSDRDLKKRREATGKRVRV